jgi:hypothetical protein
MTQCQSHHSTGKVNTTGSQLFLIRASPPETLTMELTSSPLNNRPLRYHWPLKAHTVPDTEKAQNKPLHET